MKKKEQNMQRHKNVFLHIKYIITECVIGQINKKIKSILPSLNLLFKL